MVLSPIIDYVGYTILQKKDFYLIELCHLYLGPQNIEGMLSVDIKKQILYMYQDDLCWLQLWNDRYLEYEWSGVEQNGMKRT